MNIVYPVCSCVCRGFCDCAKRQRLAEIKRMIQSLEWEKRALEAQLYQVPPFQPYPVFPVAPHPIPDINIQDVLQKVK